MKAKTSTSLFACCLFGIDSSTLAIDEGLVKRNLRQLRDGEAKSSLLLEPAFESSMSFAMSEGEPSNGGQNFKSSSVKSKSSKSKRAGMIDLTKDLEYAQGYNPDKPSTYSPGAIQLSTLAPMITGVRYDQRKIRAQLVLEKGKIVYEYYRKNMTYRPGFNPGNDTGLCCTLPRTRILLQNPS